MAPSLSKLAFSEPEASVSQDETSTMSKQQQLKNKGGTADDSRLLVSPLEIIQMICSKLDDPRHLLSFGRTCRAAVSNICIIFFSSGIYEVGIVFFSLFIFNEVGARQD